MGGKLAGRSYNLADQDEKKTVRKGFLGDKTRDRLLL